jgi:FkbM family methyltransferase
VETGWVAYDVGANIGYLTLLLAHAVGLEGRVFAFEPLPANLHRLRANLKLNSMSARVTIVPKAVTRTSGSVHFLVGPSIGTGKAEGSAGRQLDYSDTIEVPGISLDEFILEGKHLTPQVVKMDIEGGEVLAFPGMELILERFHPLLFLELHGRESARIAWDTLHEVGYHILHMRSGYPAVHSFESLDWKSYLIAKYHE